MSERLAATLAASLAGPDGAPVVALGTSIGTNQGLWDPQAAVLGRRFRLLRFEFRGHAGYQPAHLRFGFPAHLRHAGPGGSTHKET